MAKQRIKCMKIYYSLFKMKTVYFSLFSLHLSQFSKLSKLRNQSQFLSFTPAEAAFVYSVYRIFLFVFD